MARWPELMASLVFLSPSLGRRAWRAYNDLPSLPAACLDQWPSLSIIVPARNEAENLRGLLPSLLGQEYPGRYELIVVDDDSTDDTAAIAEAHGAALLSLNGLPPGWLGKPFACHQAASVAKGDWLLFTDADTCHAPDSAARAISYAITRNLDGLSLFLHQDALGFFDAAVQITALAGLFAGLSPERTTLNGQYILIRRNVYEASGGFATVRVEPLEDVALGRRLRDMGYAVQTIRGQEVAQVIMYRNFRQLWHGMARIGAGALFWSGLGGFVTVLFITAVMTPLVILILFATGRLGTAWVWLSWPVAVSGIWPWSRQMVRGNSWRIALAPLAALTVQLASCWGLVRRVSGGGVPWKGRKV